MKTCTFAFFLVENFTFIQMSVFVNFRCIYLFFRISKILFFKFKMPNFSFLLQIQNITGQGMFVWIVNQASVINPRFLPFPFIQLQFGFVFVKIITADFRQLLIESDTIILQRSIEFVAKNLNRTLCIHFCFVLFRISKIHGVVMYSN